MNYEIIKELEKEQLKENAPQFSIGDTVRVHNRIKEGNRERIQIFEGTVLKIQGGGARTRRGKVRRAKLNYLRSLSGKKAKVKALNDR